MIEINTPRLQFRPLTIDDLDHLAPIYQNRDVMRYRIYSKPALREQTETKLNAMLAHWKQYGFGRWAILDRSTQKFIGHAGLEHVAAFSEVEINYLLARSYWRQGLATEAATAILHYGFDTLRLDRVIALAHPENSASCRVLEKIGLHYQKTVELYGFTWRYYDLNRDQWNASSKESEL